MIQTKPRTLAAALAACALFAGSAYAQSSMSGSATSPSTSGSSATTSSPSTSGGLTGSVNDPSRYDSANTHLKPECFDRTAGTWKTTGECAGASSAIPGGNAAGTTGSMPSNSAPSTLDPSNPANPMPVTPGTPQTPLTTPSGALPGTGSDIGSGTSTGSSGMGSSGTR